MRHYIRDGNEIAALQAEFQQTLGRSGHLIKTKIGHRGVTFDLEVVWIPSIDVWMGTQNLETRFWNAFGIGKPQKHKSNPMLCQLNFPLVSVDRNIAGVLARDEKGNIWIGHRGRLGGDKHIRVADFKSWFRGKWMTIEGDDVVAVVGNLRGGEVVTEVGAFVREVQRLTEERHR